MNDMESRIADLLADGVGEPPQRITVQAVRRVRARRRAITSVVAVTVSATAISIVGAAYGTLARTGRAPRTARTATATAALTAVAGCNRLRQVDGTLTRVSGTSLLITTYGGQPVTVTTRHALILITHAPLTDLTDGASALVTGRRSGRTIAATSVRSPAASSPIRWHPRQPGIASVRGRVTHVTAAGFTIVTAHGTRVPVTTSSDTDLFVDGARPNQLQPGAPIVAIVSLGTDGTLKTRVIVSSRHGVLRVRTNGCTSGAIVAAFSVAFASGS